MEEGPPALGRCPHSGRRGRKTLRFPLFQSPECLPSPGGLVSPVLDRAECPSARVPSVSVTQYGCPKFPGQRLCLPSLTRSPRKTGARLLPQTGGSPGTEPPPVFLYFP